MVNVVALLTGRGNNTLKDKNILPVLGKPLLYYPAVSAIKSKVVNHYFVSSEDEKILRAAEDIGYTRIKRPEDLAQPSSKHSDVLGHAVDVIENLHGIQVDILVVLLANNGIVKHHWIDACVQMVFEDKSLTAVVPAVVDQDHHPFRAKKVNQDGLLEPYFNFEDERISTNRQDLPQNVFLSHNFWVLNMSKEARESPGQAPWYFMGDKIKPFIIQEAFDVHEEEDLLATAKWLIENFEF